jgi:hypothetical protein
MNTLLASLVRRLTGFLCSILAVGALSLACTTVRAADAAKVTTQLSPGSSHLVIDVQGSLPNAPSFYSAAADQQVTITANEVVNVTRTKIRVLQGRPETMAFGLSGAGEIINVTGPNLSAWAVRRTVDGKRMIELRPLPSARAADAATYEWVITSKVAGLSLPASPAVPLVTQGEAAGFSSELKVLVKGVDIKVTQAAGLVATTSSPGVPDTISYVVTGDARLELSVTNRSAAAEVGLDGVEIIGKPDGQMKWVDFRLRAQLRAARAGARTPLLSGRVAIKEPLSGNGWHLELKRNEGTSGYVYEVVAERPGVHALEVSFVSQLFEDGEWRRVRFNVPGGTIVPLKLEGLPADLMFDPEGRLVPVRLNETWSGFVPLDGSVNLAWKSGAHAKERTLFFAAQSEADVRIGAGYLRQSTRLRLRIHQGEMSEVLCRVLGSGEIVRVEGGNVVSWKMIGDTEGRLLRVQLSRPIQGEGELSIHGQASFDRYPARLEPLRVSAQGAIRQSGVVRIASVGAVRLEVGEAKGLTQLAASQFAGPPLESGARQSFVYRHSSGDHHYVVTAESIQPEVGVSQITTYGLGETVRTITAAVELDIREAALKDWVVLVPADYSVISASGAAVADYLVEAEVREGMRTLKLLFIKETEGRQLIHLQLEKNQPAGAGTWRLPLLKFPAAKSVRGHIGAAATSGYRLSLGNVNGLVEVPMSYFPQSVAGLQQSWRVKEAEWMAELNVEALGQSIQADVFHLYSIRQGVVYGSVLLNYFVVGAPVSEWRIHAPASLGNLEVVGQNVRPDWRREGDAIVVSLHQPVLGPATVLLTFEQPMNARGGAIRPGEVAPLMVQGERGHIQVVSPQQVKHEIRAAEGALLKLEPMELPAEYRLLSSSPTLAAYQYTARPFTLLFELEWYAQGETVDQVVDFAKLSSQVSADGQVATSAQFYVKTRGQKALRLIMPAATRLWEARVEGEIVQARLDGEHTLIPLPARLNPNEPVSVTLRLGQSSAAGVSTLRLVAPRATVPIVIGEWTLRSDQDRVLVPRGGTAQLIRSPLSETGFAWAAKRGHVVIALLLVLALASAFALTQPRRWIRAVGFACGALGIALAAVAALDGLPRANATSTYHATMVPADQEVSVEVENVAPVRGAVVGWGLGLALLGGAVSVGSVALLKRQKDSPTTRSIPASVSVLGIVAAAAGLLAQRGAAWFCAGYAVVMVLMIAAALLGNRNRRRGGSSDLLNGAPSAATLWILVAACAAIVTAPRTQAAEQANVSITPAAELPLESLVQKWNVRDGRIFAEAKVVVRAVAGQSFFLLDDSAVLTDFASSTLKVRKGSGTSQDSRYIVFAEKEGVHTAQVRYEMPLPRNSQSITVPTGLAASHRLDIVLDEEGWEFHSNAAVQTVPLSNLSAGHSGATIVFAAEERATLTLRPRGRDLGAEQTSFVVDGATVYFPSAGVVTGRTRFQVRPVQGRVDRLLIKVPYGFAVSDVARGPISAWRFDPEKRLLHVELSPAQADAFRFEVETQHGAAALPYKLELGALRVDGATSDTGSLALAFGPDTQPESIDTRELTPISIHDFDATLLPKEPGAPAPALQQVWRYGSRDERVSLKVAPVQPEIRVTNRSVITFDDERLVMALDLNVSITRVGLFKMSVALPPGLEVEALSGAALNYWSEAQDGSERVVTLHLKARTTGEQRFTATLAGSAPGARTNWSVPAIKVREATRQSAEVLLVPGRGLRLRPAAREHVTQLDPRSVGGHQPGTLAYRTLRDDWTLSLDIDALDPWTTVQALHETVVREGQTLTRVFARYRVENAAVKHVRLRFPHLTEDQIRTLRATGPAVADMVKVPDTADQWEVQFRRGVVGDTDLLIEYQSVSGSSRDAETVVPVEFVNARQVTYFVAVRGSGRLEISASSLPRGWNKADWSSVPPVLQSRLDRAVPALSYRVADAEGPLALAIRRHETADALKLRVTQTELITLFAAKGESLSAVDLKMQVIEKSTLRVRLPERARLFNTWVNGDAVSAVRSGDDYLFYVNPTHAGDTSAQVRIVYVDTAGARGPVLIAPRLNVPLENVSWRVIVPQGYALDDYSGNLRLREQGGWSSYGLETYQQQLTSKRSAEAEQAMNMLQEANTLLQQGDQQRASEVLSRVSNASALDEASNEDARVQLKKVKTQQTLLGLNTRRQRMYLDNRTDAARNEQLEQAAALNPFMQGRLNFDPTQMDQLLMGNSAEENAALRGIAARLVEQELSAEPPAGAIDVVVPQQGRVLTFDRSLQVDGNAPLELKLEIKPIAEANRWWSAVLLAAVGLVAYVPIRRLV